MRSLLTAAFMLLALSSASSLALAQEPDPWDTPTLELGQTGHGKQALVITAGPSGARAGFTVWWMDWDLWTQYGYQWPENIVAGEGSASFTGIPTLNTNGGAYTTFKLYGNQSVAIEIGDIFDETGVSTNMSTELEPGKTYVFCAYANSNNYWSTSGLTVTLDGTTTTSTNCTYTVGYWKTHPEAWPPFATMMLGSVAYTPSQLLAILNTPAAGNGLIFLAHQLIAAKLNILGGANPSTINVTMASADAAIGALVVPPTGGSTDYLSPSSATSSTQALDDFNNGISGPPHCGTSPVQSSSWGRIKSLFR